MTDRSTPRSTPHTESGGVRLPRTVAEVTGWVLIAVGALLAIVATGAGAGAGGAAALLAAGVALLLVARADGFFGRVHALLIDTGIAPDRERPSERAGRVPHHRAVRALLGETVKALNSADPASPWTIERDGSWSTAEVFDYAIYRRHEGAPPERIGIDVDPDPTADIGATALRVASSFSAGGGLYDAVLVVAATLDHQDAERLERLVSRLCGAPCVAVAVQGLGVPSGPHHHGDAEILLMAEALEHITTAHRASAPRSTAAPSPRPTAERYTPAAQPPAAQPHAEPARRETATAWRAEASEPSTPALGTAPAASDDFAALLQQASTDQPAPSRRSRSQR